MSNRARGGRSSRTFIMEQLWDKVRLELKPGNCVRARGTNKSSGDETIEVDNPITGKHEVVCFDGWYLKKFIADTRDAGAVPIVCAREVATSEKAPFLDINEIIVTKYDQLGSEKVEALFADEHTHNSRAGAELNAECVVSA